MADEFAALATRLDAMTAHLSDSERAALARKVAKTLRTANAKRIRSNRTPDGSAMTPRKRPALRDDIKAAKRSIRRDLMFRRAAKPSKLQAIGKPEEAAVGFLGRVGRIMRVHHFGLDDRVTPGSAATVRYPARPVLGDDAVDREAILTAAIEHLGS